MTPNPISLALLGTLLILPAAVLAETAEPPDRGPGRPVMYRIAATLTTLRALETRGISVEGWTRSGEVRVGRVAGPPTEGSGLAVRLHTLSTDDHSRFHGTVAVLDGGSAELWTGTVHPERVRVRRVIGTGHGSEVRVYDTRTLVPLRTGFRVVPQRQPDGRVELEIAPIVEERTEQGHVVRAAAATRVVAAPGQPVAVASAASRNEHVAIDPFGRVDHREGANESAFVVVAEEL